jgi:glutathione synthase/RimK-type ligase-like ATP-grasp enzyme
MKIGLLLNSNNALCSYSRKIREIVVKNNIPYIIIDPNSYSLFEELKGCSHLLFCHSQGDTDLKIYETVYYIAKKVYGLECSPNFEMFWQYEDKIKEYYLLRSNNFPIIDSYPFWNYSHAYEFLKKTNFPVVAKLPKGAGSVNVILIKSFQDGHRIIKQVFTTGVRTKMFRNSTNLLTIRNAGLIKYGKAIFRNFLINTGLMVDESYYPEWQIQKDAILFQRFLPNNTYDTRVTIIGKRALAFRRHVRKDDFRASGSGKIDVDPSKIDARLLEIAFSISKKLHFNIMAYDFIYGEEQQPFINEISYCFVDRIIESCPGYWDDDLKWHSGRNWPQYYQLKDFLKMEDLIPLI